MTERLITRRSGWSFLFLSSVLFLGGIALFSTGLASESLWLWIGGLILALTGILLPPGLFINQPNQSRVVTLFGR